MIELTQEQLQALDRDKQPVSAVDPRTGQRYRLIKEEVYQLICGTLKPYARGWDDDPDMEVYEQFRSCFRYDHGTD